MTLPITDISLFIADDIPVFVVVIVCVVLFIAATAAAAFVSYKLKRKQLREHPPEDAAENKEEGEI